MPPNNRNWVDPDEELCSLMTTPIGVPSLGFRTAEPTEMAAGHLRPSATWSPDASIAVLYSSVYAQRYLQEATMQRVFGCFQPMTVTVVDFDNAIIKALRQPEKKELLIEDLGWSDAQAKEARARLASFEEDWDYPGMDEYDRL